MFAFKGLFIYKLSSDLHIHCTNLLKKINVEKYIADQLGRASLSVVLNIAEGTGKSSFREKRKFLIISRSSLLETVAIIDILYKRGIVSIIEYENIESKAEEISRILFKMIQNLESK